ncbi:hypothetical protein Micbo1qcDRAFT_236009 [Microdochium bolleyi]|uniref:ADP-ribosylation factor n=1 Tax=Microdochium bolleyi TaxID=196109 RepID=A0A136ITN7_9PEZI|nr:hypothetical protein Micbo1qcDRAFT_236009 [Microdochium bolleyi]
MADSTPADVRSLFQDFDDAAVFDSMAETCAAAKCTNFVVEFGHDRARVAHDLEPAHFEHLYDESQRPRSDFPIRWINIWDTSKQPQVMNFLGERYDFSPRMISIMKKAREFNHLSAEAHTAEPRRRASPGGITVESHQIDPEQGKAGLPANGQSTASSSTQHVGSKANLLAGDDVKLFLLLKNKVNYSSIDQTDNALCIGAHWLHERVPVPGFTRKPDVSSPETLMPSKHWLWLVLTNDNTVLSLHEAPFLPEANELQTPDREQYFAECLKNIRANTLSVLLQLSVKGFDQYAHKPLSQSSVRKAMSDKHGRWSRRHGTNFSISHLNVEGASNLFYYLFEDYAAAATFQAAERTLKELTPIVLGSDTRKMRTQTAGIIPRLHSLGKDLRELKHLFENYKAMIQKILQTTQPDNSTLRMTRSTTSGLHDLGDDSGPRDGEEAVLVMAKSARERFERLGERLQWLMLNTIKGYQDETVALSDTYFNLMQQKDTAATARLNRSATLLAKLSVFFLPLSFVTSYYSIQIEEMYSQWRTRDFDQAILITVVLSFAALFFFNKLLFILIDALDKVGPNFEEFCRRRFAAAGVAWRERRSARRAKRNRGGGGGGEDDLSLDNSR